MQGIPVLGLVGIDCAAGLDAAGDGGDTLVLGLDHEGQRPALALAHNHHDAALAGVVIGTAALHACDVEWHERLSLVLLDGEVV